MSIKRILYATFVILNLVAAGYLVVITFFTANKLLDFPVFYGAARNILAGQSIYAYYGYYHLPYWYFPWVSWLFLPIASFPQQAAWTIFFLCDLVIAFVSLNTLANVHRRFSLLDRLFMFSMLLWLSWLAFRVGQLSFLILGGVVLLMLLLSKDRPVLAGLLIPILLIKPHLFIIFIPVVLWMGGKKTFLAGSIFTLLLLGIEFLITPQWVPQMVHLLVAGTQRVEADPFWNFSTLPTMLGFSQNYTGSANLPITLILAAIATWVTIRFHDLPKIPLLSLALAASLFCAPRSYAYDLVLLIPAMVWLSEKWSYKTVLLWIFCAAIPVISHYSANSFLVTLIVFGLSIYKAYSIEKQNGIQRSFWGKLLNTNP